MLKFPIHRNFILILCADMLLLAFSMWAAHMIRFDFQIPSTEYGRLKIIMPLIITTKVVFFYIFDLYRGMWRYTSIADLKNIIKSSVISCLVTVSLFLFIVRFHGFARSIFLIDLCLTILFISGFRLLIRLHFENRHRSIPGLATIWNQGNGKRALKGIDRKNLLIIGAGDYGEKIYRELRDNPQLLFNVVGFLDDDPKKIGKKIHGIPILGIIGDLKKTANRFKAQEALIAISSASYQEMRRIVSVCKESGISFKTVPGYGELIDGKITINAIREISYRDLLGRAAIKLDKASIGAYLRGQTVLVTGAGGSIGSELCRQICHFKPQTLLLFERAESPLYEIELELCKSFPALNVVPILGDIQDKGQLGRTFNEFRPQTLFHAAAYKHVPMLELQPWKAIENNIIGTRGLVEVSTKYRLERFVLVSTDKAVRPANVMGATKRVTEMLALNQNYCNLSDTMFMAVRFGNVVGSVGSVVPLFKKQIKAGGPVTVTHPDVTRFFMTISEACQLILQAGAMGNGGEIYILDMGTPIKIQDMARDLIRLSGFEPDVDVSIEYTGLRPGEKLYEELIIESEDILPTPHNNILVLKGRQCDLNFLNSGIAELAESARQQDQDGIREKLAAIVPEYTPATLDDDTTPKPATQPLSEDQTGPPVEAIKKVSSLP